MKTNNRLIIAFLFFLSFGATFLIAAENSNALIQPPLESNCCIDHETPGCDVPTCEQAVCDFDPGFCCGVEWDQNCVGIAVELCGDLCEAPSGSNCCFPHFDEPGCGDNSCEALVCEIDSFCCEEVWDGNCTGLAIELCGGLCPAPHPSDCCFQNGNPGCSDTTCEDTICSIDEFCCEDVWDETCVDQAEELCSICSLSDCCFENGSLGCSDLSCEARVCNIESECCTEEWSESCVELSEQLCEVCGGSPEIIRSIPSLSQWGLIALAGIFFVSALFILLRRNLLKPG